MSLLVKGMEMPDINDYNGISCCLYKTLGGELRLRNNETGQFFDVVTVPPHGRLVEADAVKERLSSTWVPDSRPGAGFFVSEVASIESVPTIIPAEEGDAE